MKVEFKVYVVKTIDPGNQVVREATELDFADNNVEYSDFVKSTGFKKSPAKEAEDEKTARLSAEDKAAFENNKKGK